MKRSLYVTTTAMLLLLALLLGSCTGGENPSNDESTALDTQAPTTEQTTELPTEPPISTESETEPEPEPLPANATLDFDLIEENELKKCFNSPNQTDVTIARDEGGEQYAVLTINQNNANDPHVSFDCSKYYRYAGMDATNIDLFPYVMLKIRSAGCSSGTFEMFYQAKGMGGIQGDSFVSASFDPANTDWQYILFDLSEKTNWKQKLSQLRFDFMISAMTAGEAIHIAQISFLPDDSAYYEMLNLDMDAIGIPISDEAKQQAAELLGSVTMPKTAFDSYQLLRAEHEDASLSMWFNHMFSRTPQDDTTHTGMHTYQILLAGNETEGCQVLLAPAQDVQGLRVYLTDFTNTAGDTLTSELRWGYYFKNIAGKDMYEPLPKVTYEKDQEMIDRANGANSTGDVLPNFQTYDGFTIQAGKSQMFVIKATAPANATPGEYSATFTVTDAQGNEIKKATVFAYVWDFSLPATPSCKTLMDLDSFSIYYTYRDFPGEVKDYQGRTLIQNYYEFALNYRINPYSLPVENKNGNFDSEILMQYLDDPRVQCFQTLGWKTDLNATNVSNAYAVLSQKPEWLAKAYFYPVDEPMNVGDLDRINNAGNLLKEHFPGYKLIVPMHLDSMVAGGDFFTYVADSVTAWCPHNFFFTTFAEWKQNPNLYYRMPVIAESSYGTFRDRMQAEAEGGDEVWWYITRIPNKPEITFDINSEAVNCRTLFWQQKLYDVDGFLYYAMNDWTGAPEIIQDTGNPWLQGMNPVYEKRDSDGIDIYGNGILIYSGIYFADRDPIPALRLECVRDGLEDYDYLTMLQEIYGEETVDGMIAQWTTSMYEYSTDQQQFYALRAKLALLIEQNQEQ